MLTLLTVLSLGIAGVVAWALTGNDKNKESAPQQPAEAEPEKLYRKRATDREIEESFPDEQPAHRRKGDQHASPFIRPDGSFRLPYYADDIIPSSSQLRVYRRTLLNCEVYAEKGDFTTAVSLYEGVKARTRNSDIRRKIDADIEYLKNFRIEKEEEIRKQKSHGHLPFSDDRKEIKFTLDIPPTINIGVPEDSAAKSEKLAAEIAERIRKEISESQKQEIDSLKTVISGLREENARKIDELRDQLSGIPESSSDEDKAIEELEQLRTQFAELSERLEQSLPAEEFDEEEILVPSLTEVKDSRPALKLDESEDNFLDDDNESALFTEDISDESDDEYRSEDYSAEEGSPSEQETETSDTGQFEEASWTEEEFILSPEKKEEAAESALKSVLTEGTENEANGIDETLEYNEPEEDIAPLQADIPPSDNGGEPEKAELIKDLVHPEENDTLTDEEIFEKIIEDGASESSTADFPESGKEEYNDAAPSGPPPGTESSEEDDEFELLKNIIKPEENDTLSDEEIFEKIIHDEPAGETENNFEILGDRRNDESEFDVFDKEAERKRREEESFYKNLLTAEKRYKRELPILKVSYDFKKLPREMSLSREKNLIEYSFYKYRPMLEKAQEYIDKRQVRNALNYYKVVMGQNIPPEFKAMIKRNINDLTEYLEKYLTGD